MQERTRWMKFKFAVLAVIMTVFFQTASAQQDEQPLLTIGCLSDFHIEGQYLNYSKPGQTDGIGLRPSTTKAINGMKKENVDMLILGGDYTSQTTIDQTNWIRARQLLVDTLRSVFGNRQYKPVVYITGNHEYQAPGDAGNQWYSGSRNKTKSWNSADYYSYPMKDDIGELTTGECFYESAGSQSLLAAFHYNILGVDVVALNTASCIYYDANSYAYTMESAKWCIEKIDELYNENPDRTVLFVAHIPFKDSNSVNPSKGIKGEKGVPEYLKENLARHPDIIMLYGHDHGGDNAITQTMTSQRLTRYDVNGNVTYTTDITHVNGTEPDTGYVSPFQPFFCMKNVGSGMYLGKNDNDKGSDNNNLNMMTAPAEVTVTDNGISFPHNGKIYCLSCNDRSNFSAKPNGTGGMSEAKPTGASHIYEVMASDLNSTKITGTISSYMTEGHYYIITHNGFALGNHQITDYNNKRIVGIKPEGYNEGEKNITLKSNDIRAYIYRYEQITQCPEPSFVSMFMGSLRFYSDSFNPNGGLEDNPKKDPVIVQGLVIRLFSNRIEFQMKNFGTSDIKQNGITIIKNPTPYTIFRNVRLYGNDPTSVSKKQSDVSSRTIYNLSGLKVDAAHKGLTISNGRKVLTR